MAVTTTNLGVITAYGDAVAAGYTGTKAEWQALMASYATVGQQAVDAKNAAVAAKDTAVSKATEATTAASTATTKANEASASAQSIAQSAAQIQENTDSIDQLMSDLSVITGVERITSWQTNKTVVTNQSVGTVIDITPTTKNYTEVFIEDCSEGDAFTINGEPSSGTRLYCFVDSSNKILVNTWTQNATNLVLIAPANAAKLIVNRWITTVYGDCYKGTYLPTQLSDKADKLEYKGTLSNFSSADDGLYEVSPSTQNIPNTFKGYGYVTIETKGERKFATLFRDRSQPAVLYTGDHWNLPFTYTRYALIGDSITEVNSTASINWTKLLEADGATITNLGVGGTGFSRSTAGNTNNYITRISSIPSDTQYIGVSGSWNDMSSGKSVGTADDTGNTTIAGDMNAFFDALLEAFPSIPIICYTTNPWDVYRYGVAVSDSYINVLKEICHRKGIPFKSLYTETCIRPWIASNKSVYMTDGSHPNNMGHLVLYNHLKPFFLENTLLHL